MKITLSPSTLIPKLEMVSRIATKHVTLPVLQCVVIDVQTDRVILKATNLELALEVIITEATIETTGSLAVPAQTLLQITQNLTGNTITLEKTENEVLAVKGDTTKTSIKTIDHSEFPTIPRVSGQNLTLSRESFALGIKTAAFAASQSSIKPELGSIYIHQKKEHTVTFAATDSFRLMEKTVTQKGVILNTSILIPQKNALELARLCESMDSDPQLLVTDTQCALQFGEQVYLTTRLTTGTFPDYESIIPKEFATSSTILKQDLITAFKKTNIFLNKFRQVKISVQPRCLEISSQNQDVGMVTDEIPAQTEGEALQLSFNQQYVSEPLSYINDDSLLLRFAGIGRPLVIKGVSDTSLRYLVMPMNK